MRRLRSIPVLLIALTASLGVAAQLGFDPTVAERLEKAALDGRSLAYATELTKTIGARLSGTPAYDRAAEWTAQQMRDAGVARVALESFTIPRAWTRDGKADARVIAPVDRPLAIAPLGWTPPLAGDTVEAEVISGGQELATAGDRVRGRILLVDGAIRRDFDRRVRDLGARALLFSDGNPENQIAARVRHFGGELSLLPAAAIAADSGDLLRELMRLGTVRIQLSYRVRISDGPVTSSNVIGEIVGRERPDEFIVVGAHLDSWDVATGAQDNATGVAMVLEAARAIASLGRAPRRSIRFALWGGEEQGLLGSTAYVRAHQRELDRCVAVVNTDGGTGRMIGWTTPGRDDVMTAVQELSNQLLARLRVHTVDKRMQYAFDSDGGPFIAEGIPALDLNVDDRAYDEVHHKTTDTMDRVDARNLAVGAATVAITAYAIADLPQRIAPRGPKVEPR